MSDTHKGQCFCGAVKLQVTGAPFIMGYCHCDDCRAWSAAPVNGFCLWQPEQLEITEGSEHIGSFSKTPNSHRKFCTQCGGHIYSDHPHSEFCDVYSSILPTLDFQPSLHVFYGEKTLRIRDGLPKYKDMPADTGGTGEEIPE